MDPINVEALATIPGAVAIAALIVAFVGVFTSLTAYGKRVLSAAVGVVAVVGGLYLTSSEISAVSIVLAVLNGMIAGLAASKTYEIATKGLDAVVVKKVDEGYNPGDVGYKTPE